MEIVDIIGSQCRQPSGAVSRLDLCRVQSWGLAMERPSPEAPEQETEVIWLLPDLGLRLLRHRPRRRHSRPGPTVFTAARIESDAHSWTATDLLLGLEIGDDGPARIARAEQFAAAVESGALLQREADFALQTIHRTLGEITAHRDVRQWLAHRGIFDPW
ncbi:hypothetical protein IQ251_13985 [Saccharopolyspora sp. HNM0983]|uniref:DUF402 domain-containing protein n=1 Tax=Saccharopolyspora montiporae TaxID=2781240 RepID=A0A929B973_9PSEU|nr:hypothetical protein [Saccharopolyspora sp. HNM0983]